MVLGYPSKKTVENIEMSNKTLLTKLTRNAVISALYFLLNILLEPISYGPIQLRVAEALTLLPLIFPECYIGLAIGCALSNIISVFGIFDIIFGSLITLVAGYITSKIRNIWLAPLPPVLLNAIFLPLVWILSGSQDMYILQVLYLTVSQSVVLYVLGVPMLKYLNKALPTTNRQLLS